MVTSKRVTPSIRAVVLDAEDARGLAEFYRELLGLEYRAGDEPPADGSPDLVGSDWVTLLDPASTWRYSFQQVAYLPEATWPEGPRPQMLHLDFSVDSAEELAEQHERAVSLGARVLDDRSADAEELLYVYADPAGHPFCIFVQMSP
ncbi:VOC family protein [Subtercola sp. PAMC28395]|uniref:VOC family protein n=1 Tax=Subtercola sp. PAMC28395 TaxID=2846775 RepID=UPI001C0B461F|nr:VOC family protein [Subtercola sp. PAMC28395]QWT23889.1 VOC family protein [Subtercola sp. PAMC28395]